MKLRDAHQGELTIYDRAEWEYRYGPLPEGFTGQRVYIDQRVHIGKLDRSNPDDLRAFRSCLRSSVLADGKKVRYGTANDLRLLAEIHRRMAMQHRAELDYFDMAAELMHASPHAVVHADIQDDLDARWRRERGTEPPIKRGDELEVSAP